jgi:hypothetical protein
VRGARLPTHPSALPSTRATFMTRQGQYFARSLHLFAVCVFSYCDNYLDFSIAKLAILVRVDSIAGVSVHGGLTMIRLLASILVALVIMGVLAVTVQADTTPVSVVRGFINIYPARFHF